MAWGFAMSDKMIEVDEDLPNFFNALKLSHADEILIENKNLINNFEIQVVDPCTIKQLEEIKISKKTV